MVKVATAGAETIDGDTIYCIPPIYQLSDGDYCCRRPIVIGPATSIADCQVLVRLDTITMGNPYDNVNASGSDIRFTDIYGNILHYWIEYWDNTDTSRIWVKIPDVGTDLIYMYYGNSSATSMSDKDSTMNFFETGTLTLSNSIDGGTTQFVNFSKKYVNPVVVAYIPTRNDNQSVDVRVRNVNSDSFEIFMEEPDNGNHGSETVCWFVFEAGSWIGIDEQLRIEAGTHSTSSVHTEHSSFGGDTITFANPFSATPSVFATLNTYSNGAFMSDHTASISTTYFLLQQEAGGSGSSASNETIGWAALSRNSGINDSVSYDIGYHNTDGDNDGVDNPPAEQISYSFSGTPALIVQGSTPNGSDGYWARGGGTYSNTSADFFAEEDQVGDSERSHIDEAFSWSAFYPTGVSAVVKYTSSQSHAGIGNEQKNTRSSYITVISDGTNWYVIGAD